MKVLIIVFVLFYHGLSSAQSCLKNRSALDVSKLTLFNENFKNSEKLMTTSRFGQHYSLLQLDSVYIHSEKALKLYVNFDIGPDLVAVPYSLMAYEIIIDHKVVQKEDFTDGCERNSAYTLMPGDYVELIKIKNISFKNQPKTLQIKIWGQ